MASTTFCDWCGERMEVPAGDNPLTFHITGHGGTPTSSHTMFKALPLHYHAEWHYDSGLDPDCCLAKVKALLEEHASWAHDPSQESKEWRLVPRDGRTETVRENRYRRQIEEEEARRERNARWSATPKDERIELVRAALDEQPATVRELADRIGEQENLDLYDSQLRHLVNELYATGSLDREAEEWRRGQTRYRYSLTACADGGAC